VTYRRDREAYRHHKIRPASDPRWQFARDVAVNVEPSELGWRDGTGYNSRVRGCPPIAVIGNNNWYNERFTPGSLYPPRQSISCRR